MSVIGVNIHDYMGNSKPGMTVVKRGYKKPLTIDSRVEERPMHENTSTSIKVKLKPRAIKVRSLKDIL